MSSRWTGFFIWALVAASTAFWGMKIFAATRPVPPGAQAPQAVAANGPMERLFGAVVVPTAAAAPVHPESERFQLVGVIAAPGATAPGGYAVVSIDNQPARAWHVGATLDGNTTLLAVARRTADFGPTGGPTAFSLQLPEPAAAQTGTLTPAVSQPDMQQMAAQPVANPQQFAQPQMVPRGVVGGAVGRNGLPSAAGRGGFPQQGAGAVPARGGSPSDSDANPPPMQQ